MGWQAIFHRRLPDGPVHDAADISLQQPLQRFLAQRVQRAEADRPILIDILEQMQSEIIRELAEKEDCIIVGRCADLVLTGQDVDCLSLFICAPFEWRVHHRMELENLDEKAARALVEKTDAQREKYYTHYTGRPWGLPENYDICINSARLGIERTAALLAEHCRELFSNPC